MASTSASLKCLRPKQISIRPHSKNKTKKQTKKKGKKKKKKKRKEGHLQAKSFKACSHFSIPFPFRNRDLGLPQRSACQPADGSLPMFLCETFVLCIQQFIEGRETFWSLSARDPSCICVICIVLKGQIHWMENQICTLNPGFCRPPPNDQNVYVIKN